MEVTDYIALAIPAFFVLIAAELFVLWLRGNLGRYRFDDAVTNLSCGLGQQVTGVFLKVAVIGGYVWVFENVALFAMSASSFWTWVLTFFAVDCAYYWWHRASHRVNVLWAVHVVHHQSEEYNLSVALRQAWFSGATSMPFYLPLAILGVPPVVFVTVNAFSTLYQFWIHTREIGKLGWVEWIFNTPAHHRVHHAIDPEYVDRNYAATLIIWDRLFGTFKEEQQEPVYGTVKPYGSWDPIYANFDYFGQIIEIARRATRLPDRVKVWFMPPGWKPAELGGPDEPPEVSRSTQRKFETACPVGVMAYVAVHFVLVAALSTVLLFDSGTSLSRAAPVVFTVLLTTWVWSGLFEGRAWAIPAELARLLGLAAAAVGLVWLGQGRVEWAAVGLVAVLVSSGWIWRYRAHFWSPPAVRSGA